MSEFSPLPEHETTKERWLGELAKFIVEAGKNGWAAEAPKVEDPQRPGFKELAYQNGNWEYRDSYAGYYMGPGSSVVYFKSKPVWYMSYGGPGQSEEHYDKAKETYAFLRTALMIPDPNFPVRGPMSYQGDDGNKIYWFDYQGNLAEGSWTEMILFDHQEVFKQRGEAGLIIDKDSNRQPIYPWVL
jgi:hypothetical protein